MHVVVDRFESPQVDVKAQRPFIQYDLPPGQAYICPDEVHSLPFSWKLCRTGDIVLTPVIAVRSEAPDAAGLFAAGAKFSMMLLEDYLRSNHVLPMEMRIGIGDRCDTLDDSNYRAFMTCIMVVAKNGTSV